jgi:hypothetical protein
MGLDIFVIVVVVVLTIHGFRQGFLRGAGSVLTPVVGVWLCLRNSRLVASWFSPGSSKTVSTVIAVLVILAVTYVLVRILSNLLGRLFERVSSVDLDRFLGGTLGLVRAFAMLWVVLTIAFVTWPAGRKAIAGAPLASQIVSMGNRLPGLQREAGKAGKFISSLTAPLKDLKLPTPSSIDSTTIRNLRILDGMPLD